MMNDSKIKREIELNRGLEELERNEFYLQMKDRWDRSDYKYCDELHAKQRAIRHELELLKM